MKAKITKRDGYRCAPEGHTVVTIPFGVIVEGKVAKWALEDRAAQRMMDAPENKMDAPPETKKRGRPRKSEG